METTMQAQQQTKPWYRYKGPWLIMAGPLVVVVAGIITAAIAIHNADDLVADDYYKRGKAINMDLKRQQAAASLALSADLMLGDNQRSIRVRLQGNQKLKQPEHLVLQLIHPTQAALDQPVPLSLVSDGYYQGEAQHPLDGRWHVNLEDTGKQWRLTDTWRLDKTPTLRLDALRPPIPGNHGKETVRPAE